MTEDGGGGVDGVEDRSCTLQKWSPSLSLCGNQHEVFMIVLSCRCDILEY